MSILDFKDWLSLASLVLNALVVPILISGTKWIFRVERRLTVVETLQSTTISTLVNRHRFADDHRD